MRLPICVTYQDINNGVCGNPEKCAIALAVRRRLKTKAQVMVHYNGVISINGRDCAGRSIKRQRFIHRFDDMRSSVKPIRFRMSLPKNMVKSRYKKQGN